MNKNELKVDFQKDNNSFFKSFVFQNAKTTKVDKFNRRTNENTNFILYNQQLKRNKRGSSYSNRYLKFPNSNIRLEHKFKDNYLDQNRYPILILQNNPEFYGRRKKSIIMFNKLIDTIRKFVESK